MFFLLLLGVFLAWFLANKLYETYWQSNLSVQLAFQERYLYEEDTSTIKEIVINDKLLPLPALEVRFSASRNLEFINDAQANTSTTDLHYKRDVFSFLFHQRIERTLPFTAHKRGFYQITEASLSGYDFFLRAGYHAGLPQQTSLYVYPKQVDTRRIALLCQAISGMLLSRSPLYPDPFEFSGIRDYRKEDPMHHISWKASARSGKLMVNQFDSTTSISLTLIFDMEDTLILKYEDLVEETIRITSSLSARLVKARMSFHVIGNARDKMTGSSFSVYLPAGAGNLAELNQKLACIDSADCTCSVAELLQKEISQQTSEHTYVFLSKNRNADVTKALHRLAGTKNPVLWVLPIRSAELDSSESLSIPGITVLPWDI